MVINYIRLINERSVKQTLLSTVQKIHFFGYSLLSIIFIHLSAIYHNFHHSFKRKSQSQIQLIKDMNLLETIKIDDIVERSNKQQIENGTDRCFWRHLLSGSNHKTVVACRLNRVNKHLTAKVIIFFDHLHFFSASRHIENMLNCDKSQHKYS